MIWRETASPQAQADLDSLLNDSIEAAARMLENRTPVAPFSLVIASDGSRGMRTLDGPVIAADEDQNIARLTLADDRIDLRARAIVLDVVVRGSTPRDALEIISEHREGFAFDALVPYIDSDETFMIDTESMSVSQGTRRLWPADARPSA